MQPDNVVISEDYSFEIFENRRFAHVVILFLRKRNGFYRIYLCVSNYSVIKKSGEVFAQYIFGIVNSKSRVEFYRKINGRIKSAFKSDYAFSYSEYAESATFFIIIQNVFSRNVFFVSVFVFSNHFNGYFRVGFEPSVNVFFLFCYIVYRKRIAYFHIVCHTLAGIAVFSRVPHVKMHGNACRRSRKNEYEKKAYKQPESPFCKLTI